MKRSATDLLRRLTLFLIGLAGVNPLGAQELNTSLREAVTMMPAGGFSEPSLEVTWYLPPGDGPFPVVIINHGRALGIAKMQTRYRPVLAASEFVRRGYAVVVPMRQGFSKSEGSEISGGCNVYSNGLEQARSVHRTLDWVAKQEWADVSRNVVMGQSHGGLTTLAYGTKPHPGTKLLVNFAGGLRQEGCASWQHTLIRAIGDYGTATTLPSLWFYGDNDSFFSPFVWQGAFERYRQGGAPVELVAFGHFGSDAHALFGAKVGLPIWLPKVDAALAQVGLPHQLVHVLPADNDVAPPPASGFAKVSEVEKLPVRSESARQGYRTWLAADSPKAFVIHPGKGYWTSSWGGEKPIARALAACQRRASEPCRVYSVDDLVVWTAD